MKFYDSRKVRRSQKKSIAFTAGIVIDLSSWLDQDKSISSFKREEMNATWSFCSNLMNVTVSCCYCHTRSRATQRNCTGHPLSNE